MNYEFTTPRMVIRNYRPQDIEAVWRVIKRDEIYETTCAIPKNYPKERVGWWFSIVADAMRCGTGFEFGLFDRRTGEYYGNCGIINVRRDLSSAAITYFINPSYWHQGIATECGRVMVDFAFQQLKIYRLTGTCMSINPASRRVMEKLGFVFEGTGRCELYKDGRYLNVDHLSILWDEWKRLYKR